MSQSLNNNSNTPLRANAIYIGSWDDILQFQNIQINLNADTNCQITYYTSNNKVLNESTTFNYTANSNYFNSINSTSRYVYFTVRNTTNVNQQNFNFSVIYKDFPEFTANIGSNVNAIITEPLNLDGSVFVGGNLTITGSVDANITNTSLDVAVSNFPATQDVNVTNQITSIDVNNFPATQDVNVTNAILDVDINNFPATQDVNVTNASLDVNVTNPVTSVDVNNFPATQDVNVTNASLDVSDSDTHTKLDNIQTQLEKSNKGTSTLWSNNLTGVNGVSLIANLSNVNQSNLTIFGSVNGATSIVVQFSNDGTNFYDSQYSYVQSASGNWGFSINACPLYLRLKSTSSVTATAFVNYS
jgi:hypothetical protein